MIKIELYKPFLDLDIRNNGPVIIDSNFTFFQINKIVDCLREKGELRNYNKDDKCLPLLYINDGLKDYILLILDSDISIMKIDMGSKILVNLSELKCNRGIYTCLKSQIKYLGGMVDELKRANDIAKEAFLLRKMNLYKNKSEDGPPKFKPLNENLRSQKPDLNSKFPIKSNENLNKSLNKNYQVSKNHNTKTNKNKK